MGVVGDFLRVFNLRRGELRLAGLMMVFRFAIGFTFITSQNVAITLFLSRFKGSLFGFEGVAALPVVYILSAVATAILGLLFLMLQRQFSVTRLMAAGMVVSLALMGAFFYSITADESALIYPAFATIIQIIWVMLVLNTELVTNTLFNVRQAKRIVTLLNGSETLSFITGAYTVAVIAPVIGVPNILVISIAFLVVAYFVFLVAARVGKETLVVARPPDRRKRSGKLATHGRFVALMVAFITLMQFGLFATYIQSRLAINLRFDEVDIAAFLGILQGSVGVVQAILAFFVVNRVISKVGLFSAAGLLPLSLAVTGSLVLFGPSGMVFAFIIISNAVARILQFSFANATNPLIYHCLPERAKLRLQTFLSGVVAPIGGVLSGLVLLALSEMLRGDLGELAGISWGVAAVGLVCLPVVFALRREYLSILLTTTEAKRLDVDEADFIDPAAVSFLHGRLSSTEPVEVVFAISTLEKVDPKGLAEIMPSLIQHPDDAVRLRALEALAELSRHQDLSRLADLLDLDAAPDVRTRVATVRALAVILGEQATSRILPNLEGAIPEVRVAALAALACWCGEAGLNAALPEVEALAASDLTGDREQALDVVSTAGVETLWPAVAGLLSDQVPAVRARALEVVCRLRLEEHYPAVVAALENPATLHSARRALVELGADALPVLRESLVAVEHNQPMRLALLQIAGSIDHPEAEKLLIEAVSSTDVRSRQLALFQLFEAKTIRSTLAAGQRRQLIDRECVHYLDLARMVLVVRSAAANDAVGLLSAALADAREDTVLRVLYQLRFAFPAGVVHSVHSSWATPATRHMALEILDNILKPPVKEKVMVLFDQTSTREKVRSLSRLFADHTPGPADLEETVAALCDERGRYGEWLRICALHVAAGFVAQTRAALAAPFVTADNAILREVVEAAHAADRGPDKAEESDIMLSTMEKLLFLKKATIFDQVKDEYLAALARGLEEVSFDTGEVIVTEGDVGDSMYIIVTGSVDIAKEGRVFVNLGAGECVGEMALLDAQPRSATVLAAEDCMTLVIDRRQLFEIMASEIEVARGLFKVITGRLRETRAELTELQAETGGG